MGNSQKIFGLPENEVVFTTTDGVGLRKFDQYWYVDDRKFLRRITIVSGQDFPKGIRQFSTKELAEKFLND
jgi:hypothetical protein